MTKPSKPAVVLKRRCAVYTRKSSEEGLDMEFNSLDAQTGVLRGLCGEPEGGRLAPRARPL